MPIRRAPRARPRRRGSVGGVGLTGVGQQRPPVLSPAGNCAAMASVSVSSPAPVAAETDSTLSKRPPGRRRPAPGRSDLLTATIRWGTVVSQRWRPRPPPSAPGSRPAPAGPEMPASAARLRPHPWSHGVAAVADARRVDEPQGANAAHGDLFSTVSRVVPAMSVTIASVIAPGVAFSRGFAGVRLAQQHHGHTQLQQTATRHQRFQIVLGPAQGVQHLLALEILDVLVR